MYYNYRVPGIWDLRSGTHLYDLPSQAVGVQSTAITDSGRLAITGSTSPSLTIWDVLSPPVQDTTRLHNEDITSVALSGCGGLGVCTSKSGSVCVFDADDMTSIQQLQPHSAAVNQVLTYKDRNKLISGSADGTICLWNGETGEIVKKFEKHENAVNCLAITATKDLLMSGAEDGEVAFWNVDSGKKLRTFTDHSSGVLDVAFITQKKDQFMLSSSKDGSLCIREFHSAKVVVSSQLNTGDLLSSAIAPNATFMVCGSREGSSYIISLPYGTLSVTLTGHTAAVNTVKVFPDGTRCVTGSTDCTIRVWSITDAKCIAVLHVDAPVLACDVNHNMIILYGTEGGWVSTAAFQSDPSKPNALLSRLNARDSPSISSSSTSSQEEVLQQVETVAIAESTDQGEEHSRPSNVTHKSNLPPPTHPGEKESINKVQSFSDEKAMVQGHSQSGEIIKVLSIDTSAALISTKTTDENVSSISNKTVKNTATKSTACTIL